MKRSVANSVYNNSSVIDVTAAITSRVGNGLYGARFQAGPMSQHLVEEAISDAIASRQGLDPDDS